MVGWVFGIVEYKTRNDANAKLWKIRPIQITLESLWDATKDAIFYHTFEFHQFEIIITRMDLCDRLSSLGRARNSSENRKNSDYLVCSSRKGGFFEPPCIATRFP